VYWFNTRGKGIKTFSKLQRNFNKIFQSFFKLYFTFVLFSYELWGYYVFLSKYGVINTLPLCTYSAAPARGLPSKREMRWLSYRLSTIHYWFFCIL